jgi:L-lactate dehydrogenase complex protein LldG
MSGDRDAILARIAEALHVLAPRLHAGHAHDHGQGKRDAHTGERAPLPPSAAPVTAPFREWLPAVGASFEERHALFARQCGVLRAELVDCADLAAAASHVATLSETEGWKRLAIHDGATVGALAPLLPPALAVVRIGPGYDRTVLESCDAGITDCECLVAQTGSVCVTTRSSGGRALSVIVPHHIVTARRDQLVPDLTAAYERLAHGYGGNLPSMISFITGPSRTGDIERILVLGAHGPKRLTILLLP